MATKLFTDTAGDSPAQFGQSVARVTDGNLDRRPGLQSSTALRPIAGRSPVAGVRNRARVSQEWTNDSGFSFFGSDRASLSMVPVSEAPSEVQEALAASEFAHLTALLRVQHDSGDNTQTRLPVDGYSSSSSSGRRFSVWGYRLSGDIHLTDDNGNSPRVDLQQNFNRRVRSSGGRTLRSGSSGGLAYIAAVQMEVSDVNTPYQRTNTRFDVTEQGFPSPGYLRFDLSDDRIEHAFPDGFTGDVMVFGRDGSWIEEGVTIAPGGTMTIGPNRAVNAAPVGSLDVLGDIVGWLPIGRETTPQERQYMIDYYKERGASSLLIPGPDDCPPFSAWTGDISDTPGNNFAYDAGPPERFYWDQFGGTMRYIMSGGTTTNTLYLVNWTTNISSGTLRLFNNSPAAQNEVTRNVSGNRSLIIRADGPNGFGFRALQLTGIGELTSFSLRELRPQEDW